MLAIDCVKASFTRVLKCCTDGHSTLPSTWIILPSLRFMISDEAPACRLDHVLTHVSVNASTILSRTTAKSLLASNGVSARGSGAYSDWSWRPACWLLSAAAGTADAEAHSLQDGLQCVVLARHPIIVDARLW